MYHPTQDIQPDSIHRCSRKTGADRTGLCSQSFLWQLVGHRLSDGCVSCGPAGHTAYYEAAAIDGAGRWDAFRYITLPLLKPTTLYILVTSVISSFQVFGLINVLTGGGPLDATQVVVSYIFKRAFGDLQFGLAAAMSFVLFGIILVITVIQWKFLGREVTYE